MPAFRRSLPFAVCTLALALEGCQVHNEKHGDNGNVDIGTPFGSLQVSNDGGANPKTGLTPYPGAIPVHKSGEDGSSADVNMSFGSFKLGVHALELQTADPQGKVLAFYRSDMSHFGAVLTCRGSKTVGQPTRTAQGLTCDHDEHGTEDGDEIQLRAGSPEHQHIVGLHAQNGGTRIGLVALDLPGRSKNRDGDGDGNERE